jgi:hypothetical protein
MRPILIAAALLLSAAVAVPAVADQGKSKPDGKRPAVIQLPTGFGPEGITTSKRHAFFAGSRQTGAVYKGSLRTGEGDILVGGGGGKEATGLKVDRYGRLFVSGATSDAIRIYDAETGEQLRVYTLDAGFINDVVITRRGAYFTDSQNAVLYHIPFGKKGALGDLDTIELGGEYTQDPGFNANGIEAARGGKSLIVVKSNTGQLFDVDAATGVASEIPVTGGDGELAAGDGLLLKGRKLYVVENQDNRVTVVKLRRNLSSGRIVGEIDSDRFNVPTTIARSGGRNYVVNAKFGSNTPDQTYEVVMVPKK